MSITNEELLGRLTHLVIGTVKQYLDIKVGELEKKIDGINVPEDLGDKLTTLGRMLENLTVDVEVLEDLVEQHRAVMETPPETKTLSTWRI